MRQVEQRCEFLDIFRGGLGLAVEERCYCDLAPAESLPDGFEGEAFGGFGLEEDG